MLRETETGITLRQAQGSAYSNAPAFGSSLGSSGTFSANAWTTVGYSSREGANAPQLVIQTSSGPTDTPTFTPTYGPTPTPTNTPSYKLT